MFRLLLFKFDNAENIVWKYRLNDQSQKRQKQTNKKNGKVLKYLQESITVWKKHHNLSLHSSFHFFSPSFSLCDRSSVLMTRLSRLFQV